MPEDTEMRIKKAGYTADLLRQMLGEGVTLGVLAEATGVHRSALSRWLRALGIETPGRGRPKGKRSGMREKTARQVELAHALRRAGMTYREIGDRLGLTRMRACQLC
ncbi:MAG: hypothetical protein GWO40_05330, partial [Gammaproteobacteria bacterium]|nr:hypothetical protein [Gammaproteobacteria bacterium]NIX84984.1 hypothetical protein [Gammaproteobacteria bacterium]